MWRPICIVWAFCAGLHTFKGLFDAEALALTLQFELGIMSVKVPTKIEMYVFAVYILLN